MVLSPAKEIRFKRRKGTKSTDSSSMARTTIKDLPESLLVHILSLLPTIDAMKTTFVSHMWNNLWYQVPFLTFDIVPIHSPPNPYSRTREIFSEIVYRAIELRPSFPINKFQLRFDCGSEIENDYVHSWILHAINSKVFELDLDFDVCGLSSKITEINIDMVFSGHELVDVIEHRFNFSYLRNSSIRDLKLNKCDIFFPSNVCTNDFASIRSLYLGNLYPRGNDVDHVIQNCVNLEHLTIHSTILWESLSIRSEKLKTCELVNIVDCGPSLEIYAPSLQSIKLKEVLFGKHRLNEFPSLVEAQLIFLRRQSDFYDMWCDFMRSANNVKYLTVQNMPFCQEKLLESYQFNNLIHLELLTGYSEADVIGICSFLQHSVTLESLTINYCYDGDGEETKSIDFMSREVIIHIPRLRKVIMKSYRGRINQVYVLELLKIHKVVLEEVVAFPRRTSKINAYPLWTASDHQDPAKLADLKLEHN